MKKYLRKMSWALSMVLLIQWMILPVFAGEPLQQIQINFQDAGGEIPAGYIADFGDIYGERNGYTYGWNDNHTDNTFDRGENEDKRLDTGCRFHEGGIWEIELLNGIYEVTVGVGDAVDSNVYAINAEDVTYWTEVELQPNQFLEKTKTIEVTDGRLTLDHGTGGEGDSLINYIIISPNGVIIPEPEEEIAPEPENPTEEHQLASGDLITIPSEVIAPEPENPTVKLQMYNNDRKLETNNISTRYKLQNIGTTPIDLEDLKIRYYYTVESEQDQDFYCDWSDIGTNKITGSFVKLPQPSEEADHYLEIGFKAGTKNLEPGEDVEIHIRIAKVDWSNYNQANDYSFHQTATDYVDWDNSVVYLQEDLLWGQDEEALTPVPVEESVKLQMYNFKTTHGKNTIYPRYRLVNTGNVPVDIHDIKIRYYYTGEGENPQNFFCDWSSIGAGNIMASFVELDNPCEGADRYVELEFTQDAGVLGPEGSIDIHTRIAQEDWSEYIQTNDYSFNESGKDYVDWDKVTVYINGELKWGIEPTEIPTHIIDDELPLRIQMYNKKRQDDRSTVSPRYLIYNVGTVPINLKDVKIRYYYTIDGEKEQNFFCDWSTVGSDQVTGSFGQIPDAKSNGDYFFELGFKVGAGVIYPEEWVEVHTRVAKTDWADYIQTDDFSFNETAHKYEDWTKVNGYLNGILVWGEAEFFGTPENISLEASENTIEIQWDEVEFTTDYEIETDGVIHEVNGTNHYTHVGLLPGTEHTYKVRAITKAVTGDWSSEKTKWTLPDIPENILVNGTSNSITLSWDPVTGATGYDVEVYGTPIDNGNSTIYTEDNINPNTQRTYRVRAKNASGVGKWSMIVAKATLPGTTSGLQGTATDSMVQLLWNTVAGATGYDLEIDGIIISDISSVEYMHVGLEANSSHLYRVRAKNSEGYSPWSDSITVTTLPSTPHNLQAIVNNQGILVTWDSVNGSTGYDIAVDGQIIDNDISASYLHTGIEPNTEHTYRVRAKNGFIYSEWSSLITKTTLVGVPTNIRATSTSNQIDVMWDIVVGAIGYDIEVDGVVVDSGLNTSYQHKNLGANTEHSYRVRTKNAGGTGQWSEMIYVSTVLGNPVNLQTTVTSNSISLTWDPAPGANGYDVLIDGVVINNGESTSYVHSGLEPFSWHIYSVRAKIDEFVGEWSEAVTVSTLLGTPSNLQGTATSNQITITWDPVQGATIYEVEADGTIVEVVGDTVYVHENLLPNTLHNYRVRAKNESVVSDWSGSSDWSTLLPIMTPPSVPTNLRAIPTTNQMKLNWDSIENASAYDLEIDGEIVKDIEDTTFIHNNLEPNTRHTYRVSAKNAGGASEWSEILEKNTVPELTVNVGKDNMFNFVIVAPQKDGVENMKIVVTYNSDEIEVVDLCAATPEANLETGNIAGTNIRVESFTPGKITYVIQSTGKTVMNAIKFLAKSNDYSKITYTIE
jgi:hypothetical protein